MVNRATRPDLGAIRTGVVEAARAENLNEKAATWLGNAEARTVIREHNKGLVDKLKAIRAASSEAALGFSENFQKASWRNGDKFKVLWNAGGRKTQVAMIAIPVVTAVALGTIIHQMRGSHTQDIDSERAAAPNAERSV